MRTQHESRNATPHSVATGADSSRIIPQSLRRNADAAAGSSIAVLRTADGNEFNPALYFRGIILTVEQARQRVSNNQHQYGVFNAVQGDLMVDDPFNFIRLHLPPITIHTPPLLGFYPRPGLQTYSAVYVPIIRAACHLPFQSIEYFRTLIFGEHLWDYVVTRVRLAMLAFGAADVVWTSVGTGNGQPYIPEYPQEWILDLGRHLHVNMKNIIDIIIQAQQTAMDAAAQHH
jgi:hypothetical protein